MSFQRVLFVLLGLLVTIMLFSVDTDIKNGSKVILFYWYPPKLCCSYSSCQCACQHPKVLISVWKARGTTLQILLLYPVPPSPMLSSNNSTCTLLHCPVVKAEVTPQRKLARSILPKSLLSFEGSPVKQPSSYQPQPSSWVTSLSTHTLPNHIFIGHS